jgi:hypothetical protein
MPTIEWLALPRRVAAWADLPADERAVLQGCAQIEAEGRGRTVPAEPIAGWTTAAHSRDGKQWPCREQTNGARPAWVWRCP